MATRPMLNAMTIDLEDWAQAVLDPRSPVTHRVVGNVERLLGFLAAHRVRATFFALGKVCERHPRLLPTIADAGHEIASHGYGHELVYHLSPGPFEADIARSVAIIESQISRPPVGYRAPAFSIIARSRWAGPILAEAGFKYSSSIFPVRNRRYGIPDAPPLPHRWPNCPLVEFPFTTMRVWGWNLPVCGGGYTRLLPAWIHARAIRRVNDAGHPAVVYLHPYELAVGEVGAFRRSGFRVSWRRYLMQSLWRSRVAPRLLRLFGEFQFAPMAEVLGFGDSAPARATGSETNAGHPEPRGSIPEHALA